MPDYKVNTNDPLPRYYQVYVSLEARIRSGEFSPGEALPSERQLSLDYGVSRITIVKALDLLVRDSLIDRQHGRGNFVLPYSDTATCRTGCKIAFCVPTPSESYIFSTLMGATRVAMEQGVQLQVVEVGSGEEEPEVVRDVIAGGVNGLILFSRSTHLHADLYRDLQARGFPFVMIDRYSSSVATDSVVFDDWEATYQLTNLLIEAGHRRIAILLSNEPEMTSVRERLRGYREALEAHGLVYDKRLVCLSVFEAYGITSRDLDTLSENYTDMLTRLHREGPTAFVVINNYSAEQANIDLMKIQMELMQAALNASVADLDPELNVAVASISHKLLSHTYLVMLALQPGETLGEKAMHLVLGRIDGTVVGPPKSIVLPMDIVLLEDDLLGSAPVSGDAGNIYKGGASITINV